MTTPIPPETMAEARRLDPNAYYWCDRDSEGRPWRIKGRVGVGPDGMSEAEYAMRLNAVAPRAVDHRCLVGREVLAQPHIVMEQRR